MDPLTTLETISSALLIVDKIANQIGRYFRKEKEPEKEKPYSVLAHKVGDEIHIERYGSVVTKITRDDIDKLPDSSRSLIEMYEKSMERTFKIWQTVYPQRGASPDPVVNAQIDAKLDELAKSFCADLGHIFKFLGSIGYELEDHYSDVRYICSQVTT